METKTILSERAITHFESLIYWYCDNFTWGTTTHDLMNMLRFYVKANPGEPHSEPSDMVCTVSRVIQLLEQLNEAIIFEDVESWECGVMGYEKPELVKCSVCNKSNK